MLHRHSLVTNMDRPLAASTGSFEDYLDYFHNNVQNIDENILWMGKKAKKFPMDAWIYQEIIHLLKPDIVIEIGNLNGGSTLFLANMLDIIDRGKVLALDIDHSRIDFTHPRIDWITGDANSRYVLNKVESQIREGMIVIVIEDSSHTYDNTLAVLRNYNRFVTMGSYFIVEDGVCKYPFIEGPKPGPYDAIQDFIKENTRFEVDRTKEKFALTYNPSGYLKRVR